MSRCPKALIAVLLSKAKSDSLVSVTSATLEHKQFVTSGNKIQHHVGSSHQQALWNYTSGLNSKPKPSDDTKATQMENRNAWEGK